MWVRLWIPRYKAGDELISPSTRLSHPVSWELKHRLPWNNTSYLPTPTITLLRIWHHYNDHSSSSNPTPFNQRPSRLKLLIFTIAAPSNPAMTTRPPPNTSIQRELFVATYDLTRKTEPVLHVRVETEGSNNAKHSVLFEMGDEIRAIYERPQIFSNKRPLGAIRIDQFGRLIDRCNEEYSTDTKNWIQNTVKFLKDHPQEYPHINWPKANLDGWDRFAQLTSVPGSRDAPWDGKNSQFRHINSLPHESMKFLPICHYSSAISPPRNHFTAKNSPWSIMLSIASPRYREPLLPCPLCSIMSIRIFLDS